MSSGAPLALRFPGQWFQLETGLHQNWMRDYDPAMGRYLQADPLGLIAGASVFGYGFQSPGLYVDPDGNNPLIFAAGFAAAFMAWDLWDQLHENDWRLECVNLWRLAGAGVSGAALGPMARVGLGSAAGLTRWGAGMEINGLVGASGRISSMNYNTVSKRLRAANGLTGNSGVQLHHWAITQGSSLGTHLGQSGWGRAILNSRWNLNPIERQLNGQIGKNAWTRTGFWNGAPAWARFGPPALLGGQGLWWGTGCECSR